MKYLWDYFETFDQDLEHLETELNQSLRTRDELISMSQRRIQELDTEVITLSEQLATLQLENDFQHKKEPEVEKKSEGHLNSLDLIRVEINKGSEHCDFEVIIQILKDLKTMQVRV